MFLCSSELCKYLMGFNMVKGVTVHCYSYSHFLKAKEASVYSQSSIVLMSSLVN
ncbi:hypothetical protein Hanom_Chr03g00181521 [Helianthus anomalus]